MGIGLWAEFMSEFSRDDALMIAARCLLEPGMDSADLALTFACGENHDPAGLRTDLGFVSTNILPYVSSGTAIVAAFRCISFEMFQDALVYARCALNRSPASDQRLAWLAMATALQRLGHVSPARITMVRAIAAKLELKRVQDFDLVMLYHAALGEAYPRYEELTKPCPLLGTAGVTLDPKTEAIISASLDAHLLAFETQPYVPDLIPAPGPEMPESTIKVLTVFGVAGPEDHIHDIPDCFEFSGAKLAFEMRRFPRSADLLYDHPRARPAELVAEAKTLLFSMIDDYAPDLVLLDGNFVGHAGTVQNHDFPTERAYKLVVTISDLIDAEPNKFDYWGPAADLIVYVNQRTSLVQSSPYAHKGFYWPCHPFDEDQFPAAPEVEKNINLSIIGTNQRTRDLFALCAYRLDLPGFYFIHGGKSSALKTPVYRQKLAASRMIVNNGKVTANQWVVTGRVFEAAFSRAVLLEELGNDIDRLFVPWVHYLPFSNVHQLLILVQYMMQHDDRRQAMADRAQAWARQHFPSAKFWASLRARLAI